jgi:uncharacterized membrane protein
MTPGTAVLEPKRMDSRAVAGAAVFTAFVAVATMSFALAIPATPSGYFNLGEVMVYIAALLTGPYVGAFSGGVGSMLSDLALGASNYAPGTLVIKGAEGFVVGYLSSRVSGGVSRGRWRATTIVVAAAVGLLLGILGDLYFTGSYQLTLGLPVGGQTNIGFDVPVALWVGLGLVAFSLIVVAGYFVNEKVGWTVFAVLAGGSIMVTGYFLYNYVVLAIGFVPSAGEVPFDIGQALVGLLVAIPIAGRIRRIFLRTAPAVGGPQRP